MWRRSVQNDPEIEYTPVQEKTSQIEASVQPLPGSAPEVQRSTKSRARRWSWHFLSHIFALLWLAPIIALLVLNYKRHVIGASVWCPKGKCSADPFGDNAIARAEELDLHDHDILGALQFVAKALEVWFMIAATSLLFDVAMLFAKKGRGLPIGFLLTHLEFGDIRNLINPLLWTSPRGRSESRARTIKLYLFAILATFLTTLTNMMGPATAVLILPTLQWVDTAKFPAQRFNGTGISSPPGGDRLIGCTNGTLQAGNYSCTADFYGPSLDAFAAYGIESSKQIKEYGYSILSSSQEAAVQYTINATANGSLTWVPNRQVLRDLSYDFLQTSGNLLQLNPPVVPDPVFNNSLQAILHREGPSIGVQADCYNGGNLSIITVAPDKEVRCYSNWTIDYESYYTKCIHVGKGWNNPQNAQNRFWLGNTDPSITNNITAVDLYFSTSATYFNETFDFGSGIKPCLSNTTSSPCDWDKIFSTPLPHDLKNSSINTALIAYEIPNSPNPNARVWCDSVSYLSFPTYSIDTSPSLNDQNLVQLDHLTLDVAAEPLVTHPDWILAAWSVDSNGTVDGTRQIAQEISRTLTAFWNPLDTVNLNDTLEASQVEFGYLHFYAVFQGMSMVNYHWYNTTAPPSVRAPQLAEHDPQHPLLTSWATLHVWAFGLSDKTSKMGVVIVIIGGIVVLCRTLLGIATGIRDRSTVELFVAALEQGDKSGAEGAGAARGKEWEGGKVRWVMVEDTGEKAMFMPENEVPRRGRASSVAVA